MGKFAEGTTVGTDASRAEIERTLVRYGADSFAYGWSGVNATVQFAAHGRHIRFQLAMPDREDAEFTEKRVNQYAAVGRRTEAEQYKAWEQACRQKWRALALVIKAKLEAVESGISEFEEEFLANIVLPNGETAGDWMRPQIAQAYETRRMPAMLPELGRAK